MTLRCSRSRLVLCSLLLVIPLAQSPQSPLDEVMKSITNDLTNRGTVSWTATARRMLGTKWKTTNNLEEINSAPSSCSLAWTSVDVGSEQNIRETYTVPLQAVSSVEVRPYSRSNPYQAQWDVEFLPDTYLVRITTGKVIAGRRQVFKKSKLTSDTELPNNHEASIRFLEERTATKVANEIRRAASLCGSPSS